MQRFVSIFVTTIFVLLLFNTSKSASTPSEQEYMVYGKVTDTDGQPLPGANVYIKGLSLGTATNINGEYEIKNIKQNNITIVVSFIGYKTVEKDLIFSDSKSLKADFTLEEENLSINEIVVTGISNPRTKLESSVAISTIKAKEIELRVPRNNADLLKVVPGLWVESTGGEGPANVWVRGFPQSGGYAFIGLMEDGLPIFQGGYNTVPSPDQFIKTDATIKTVEAIRGGTAPIVMQGAAGAVINYVSKTGTNNFDGIVKLNYSPSQKMGRADLNVGGPISKGITYNIGGFYRTGHGVYDYGYAANKGGQLKANLVKNFRSGNVKVYTKIINDRVNWNLPSPYIFHKDGSLGEIPGFDLKTDGSAVNEVDTKYSYVLPDSSTFKGDLKDGFKTNLYSGGIKVNFDIGNNWILENNFRYDDISLDVNSDIVTNIAPLDPNTPYFYTDGTQLQNVSNLNGNGLFMSSVLIANNNSYKNIIDRLELTKSWVKHNLTFGFEYFYFDLATYSTTALFKKELKHAPRMIIEGNPNAPALMPVALVHSSGIGKANGSEKTYSVYVSEEYKINDQLRIDMGARYDNKSIKGENATKKGKPIFMGGKGFVLGDYIPFDDSEGNWAATIGTNYKLNNHTALFARGSRGYNGKKLGDYTVDGVDIDYLKDLKSREIYQGEVGIKYGSTNFALFTSLLYANVKNATSQIFIPTPDGSLLRQSVYKSTETYSAEIEAQYKPTRRVLFKLVSTFQEPKYTDLTFTAREGTIVEGQTFDWSGNTAERVPKVTLDFMGSYTVSAINVFANVRYYSSRWSTPANRVKLKGFTIVNAGASYKIMKNLGLSVSVANLFNTIALTEGNTRGDQFADLDSIEGKPRLGRRTLPFSLFSNLTYEF